MIHRRLILSLVSALLCGSVAATAQSHQAARAAAPPDAASPDSGRQTVYDFSLVDPDGKVVSLADYKGKVMLIVNLASQSMFNTQIAALNDLEKTYGPRGLVIIGIPTSEFGGEELKDAAAVRKYYTDTAKVDFPVFAPAQLTGIHAIPLYQFLCDPKQSLPGGAVSWNYTKFLIDRNGKPMARYEADTDPGSADFRLDLEHALSGTFKRRDGGEPGGNRRAAGGGNEEDDRPGA